MLLEASARLYAIALPLDIIYKQSGRAGKGYRCNPVYDQRIGVSNLVQPSFIAADSWPAKRDRSGSFLPD
ncbi:MAG TPA: hypothetical protein VGE44_04815 [Daejeonella sp.]|uniref:hypothetical protein n=1 Tax=Daejeonella sp. TaxID=2805397 RepID=UPI002EDA0817